MITLITWIFLVFCAAQVARMGVEVFFMYLGDKPAKSLRGLNPVPQLVTNDPEFGIYAGYVCPVWNDNRIEREVGGNDFMSCGNIECPGCFPNGVCEEDGCDNPGTDEWKYGSPTNPTVGYLCAGHKNVRAIEREKNKEAYLKKQEETAYKIAGLDALDKPDKERTVEELMNEFDYLDNQPATMFNLRRMERIARLLESLKNMEAQKPQLDSAPAQVPPYANRRYDPSLDVIVWTWIDTDTGRAVSLKQIVPPTLDTTAWKGDWHEQEVTEIRNGNGEVVRMEPGGRPDWIKSAPEIETTKKWRPPTDPESDPFRPRQGRMAVAWSRERAKRTTSPGPSAGMPRGEMFKAPKRTKSTGAGSKPKRLNKGYG